MSSLVYPVFCFTFLYPVTAWSACPPGTDFQTRNNYNENVPVSATDLALNEGAFTANIDFILPVTDAGINISSGGFDPTATISPHLWQWHLRIPRPTTITVANLLISYQVTGSDGTVGSLTSVLDSSSHVQISVLTRDIRQRQFQNHLRFLGDIDLEIDYSNVTRAGAYTGAITTTVDCQ